jgi:hypothetical protein
MQAARSYKYTALHSRRVICRQEDEGSRVFDKFLPS